jgi:Heparinase II/III-like protein
MLKKHILLFLIFSTTIFFSCAAKSVSAHKTLTALNTVSEKITAHPRLLLKQGEEQKINTLIQTNPSMLIVHQAIINDADKILLKSPSERVLKGKRLLDVSNEALKRIYFLSYAFRMTGDDKYAQRAEKELIAVCDFENWNPSHFLDVAGMTMGVAIGYDWLFDKLSESTREKIRKAIIEKAFTPAGNEKYTSFYKASNNWNQVCNAGLVLGALAIYDEEPEISKGIIEKSVKSIPLAMQSYGPDGAYPEGYSYWGYGTGFQVTMMTALESALGTDYKLSEDKGFMNTPYYMLMMLAPSGLCYNFGDSGSKPPFQPAMFWFSAKLNDTSILFHEQKTLAKLAKGDIGGLLPNILIFSKDIELKEAKTPEIQFYSTKGNKPLFIYRSGWNDKNDAYLGVVGGRANASHGHMDAGSFVYEKNGVRWSLDLGLQSYSSLESKGVALWNNKQDGQRWDVFRIGPKGHSTLTINGERHLVAGEAKITKTFKTKDCKGAELDLSPVFANSVRQVIRKVSLDAKNDLSIIDKIKTNDKDAKVAWQMVAPNDAKIVGPNQIELTKDGKKMLLTVTAPTAIEMKIETTISENSFDEENPGSLRVGFETNLPADTTSELIIKLTSQN